MTGEDPAALRTLVWVGWLPGGVLFLLVFVLVAVLVVAAVIVCMPIVPSSHVLPHRRCLCILSVFVAAFAIVIFTVIIIVAHLRQPAVVEIGREHFGCESSLCKPIHGPICIPVFAKKKVRSALGIIAPAPYPQISMLLL